MIPEKGKRYLIEYTFDNNYINIGTYTGETWREKDGIEYRFRVDGGTILVVEEEIKKCIDNPNAGAWEKIADELVNFAEIVRAIEGNSTMNPEYYNKACSLIEEYKKLKNV